MSARRVATLEADQLIKRYGRRTVVDQVSVTVNAGEIVGLLGPNGAGKTTTFRMIMGIIRPDGGSIRLDGIDVTTQTLTQRARKGVGYLSQEPSIFRRLTVEQNLQVVLENQPLNQEQQKERAAQLLAEAELNHLLGRVAETLSGGEKRRLEICRALAARPRILLLDEPFSGVDPIAVSELQEIIQRLKSQRIGILITDHSVRETLEVTDRSYIVNEGKILTLGKANELINDPIVREIYLGQNFYYRDSSNNSE